MAKTDILLKIFLDQENPKCFHCIRAKATRRQWRNKRTRNKKSNIRFSLDQVVSVDQLITDVSGYIAQMVSISTRKKYVSATVFVDQTTRYIFIYLQTNLDADKTIKDKKFFKKYFQDFGYPVFYYYADNDIFVAKKWRDHCKQKKQLFSFAGIGIHYQNGVTERKIRDLQNVARAIFFHVQKEWPGTIDKSLWPYALRIANDVTNYLLQLITSIDNFTFPLQKLFLFIVNINLIYWYPFGTPIYSLQAYLQQESRIYSK